jgi:hypothetical protein
VAISRSQVAVGARVMTPTALPAGPERAVPTASRKPIRERHRQDLVEGIDAVMRGDEAQVAEVQGRGANSR